MVSNIAITGASGFVGQNLIPYLENNGYTVSQISRLALNTIPSFGDSECIVHLAGKAHDLKATNDAYEYEKINFILTKKLYDEFLISKARIFIFISSVKAVADHFEGELSEATIPDPKTAYGRSKLLAEDYIKTQQLSAGKFYYILRPCMIHGPGNKGNLNLLYKLILYGLPYPLAKFENRRSFLSVENLCFIIKAIIAHSGSVPSGVYNVADDSALSTNEVVSILAHGLKKKPKLWHVPRSFIVTIAKFGNVLRLPLNTERLNKLTENFIVSNKKIKQALHTELPVETKDGLIKTAESFRKL